MNTRMYYFGPWDRPGHFFHDEKGRCLYEDRIPGFPFGHDGGRVFVDCALQPGAKPGKSQYDRSRPEVEGEAALHHIQGWTALCIWDRSVDGRGACSSNYFAEGTFTFEEVVMMASTRFAVRWNKMTKPVVLVAAPPPEEDQKS